MEGGEKIKLYKFVGSRLWKIGREIEERRGKIKGKEKRDIK